MRVLWVTSFAPDMYADSGAQLVRSFLASGTEGTLLVCVEQEAAGEIASSPGLIRYRLEESTLLAAWLAANRYLIPDYLGGLARKCDCPEGWRHRKGCHWDWYNRNASRWFRKIASLDRAAAMPGFDAVVWLDSDCEILHAITQQEVASWFGDAAVFYHKSVDRTIVESGVLGFRLNPDGHRWFRSTADRYLSGEFRLYPRWDDGYQFQVTLNLHPEIPAIDLAERADDRGRVLPYSVVGKFLAHHKGVHRRREIML